MSFLWKYVKLIVYCLLKLGRPVPNLCFNIHNLCFNIHNLCFNIHNPVGLKLLTRLGVGLSHLNKHKFKYSFSNYTNPLCSCSLELESTTHFFLYCLCFSSVRKILFNELVLTCKKFVDLPDSIKVELLLYRSPDLSFTQNSSIINASIKYITKSGRFKGNLF